MMVQVAAVLVALTMPARQTPGANVHVTHCYLHTHSASARHPWVDAYGVTHQVTDFPSDQAFLAITYINTLAKPATTIEFGLVSRGELVAVARDRGVFAHNVPVAHEFVILRLLYPRTLAGAARREIYCAVLNVTYADGSSWRNPNPHF